MADIALAPQRAKTEIREATRWDQLKHNKNWLGFWFMIPAMGFLVLFLAWMVVYAISFILIQTLSRYREFAADRGAALITGRPSALSSALYKISSGMAQIPKQDLRSALKLQQTNLLEDFSRLGPFDVIFCRNVLIYFQNETKKDILDRMERVVRSDGYLLLGSAETVLGITESFRRIGSGRSSIYLPASGLPVR